MWTPSRRLSSRLMSLPGPFFFSYKDTDMWIEVGIASIGTHAAIYGYPDVSAGDCFTLPNFEMYCYPTSPVVISSISVRATT